MAAGPPASFSTRRALRTLGDLLRGEGLLVTTPEPGPDGQPPARMATLVHFCGDVTRLVRREDLGDTELLGRHLAEVQARLREVAELELRWEGWVQRGTALGSGALGAAGILRDAFAGNFSWGTGVVVLGGILYLTREWHVVPALRALLRLLARRVLRRLMQQAGAGVWARATA